MKQIIRISLLLILHLSYAVITEILNAWHIYSYRLDPPEGYILIRNTVCVLISVIVFAVMVFYVRKTGDKNGFVRLYPPLMFALSCTNIILRCIPSHDTGTIGKIVYAVKPVFEFVSAAPMSAMFIVFDDMMSAQFATLFMYFAFWMGYGYRKNER